MDILEEIVAYKRREIEEFRLYVPETQLAGMVEKALRIPVPSMREALVASETGIIAEFKRRSPSKGWIHRAADPDVVTKAYEENGASALSILTDQHFFGGYDEFVRMARIAGVKTPILYKNFIIDEYQLLQARYCGASAVLLIAASLSMDECARLLKMAHSLGMEVLLEMHNDRDIAYAELKPDMYGINNRNLGTFETNVENSFNLIGHLPENACRVSESGIHDAETVKALREAGFHGFLMGENFMKAENPGMALGGFIHQLKTS